MTQTLLREQIVDAALALAERGSWESVRLTAIAAELSVTLDELRTHIREKEDIVDAWFDRADRAMLKESAKPDVVALPARERLRRLLMVWLGALAAHRKVTRQMIAGKLEPGHFHYQLAGLLRISRTVQWLREAAGRDAVLPRRAFEEAALTGIYLATFMHWLTDDSPNGERTERFLGKLLNSAERVERMLGLRVPGP